MILHNEDMVIFRVDIHIKYILESRCRKQLSR